MARVNKVHHVAVVVDDLDSALAFWQDTLGIALDHIEEVPSQNAKVAFLPVGEIEVELVQPLTEDSGIARFLSERGGGMHHLCLQVNDILAMLARLKSKGVRLINEEPLELEGRKMAFIHPKSAKGVLIEIYELCE